ncbi:ATP-dependent helicase [Herbidospora sp. NEAU-GS84]|uniref:ATP-dependent helicase n=1 Tax=Herbidospora solisilvae TaxID=2696284 RepID=A0A7C9J489_9ACTN|nr:DEAD/DEAH box helicase [Herbidospora solisilvae]NAS24282.1 ATP-dependent helicase [Herbidospora solisilvae]
MGVREADDLCRVAEALVRNARTLLADHAAVQAGALSALDTLRRHTVRDDLEQMPVARLKDVTGGRLRTGMLERSGITTVLQVHDLSAYRLQQLPGVGAQTARQIKAAADQIEEAARQLASVRIERGDWMSEALVVALKRLLDVGTELPFHVRAARDVDATLTPLLRAAHPARSRWRLVTTGRRRRAEAHEAVAAIDALLDDATRAGREFPQAITDLLRPPSSGHEAWADFEHRSADYYALLADLAGERVTEGVLPDDVLARVNAQPLDDTFRRVSLRGYQSFGARFALAQKRVIIGDEMGLGKSIEAIAALAHLAAEGASRFLVVCPASVVVNWVREIETRSTLKAQKIHGTRREAALDEWEKEGGVAVVTLDGLHRLTPTPDVAMLVVDEAHYVKNPATKRAGAVAAWCRVVERVLFLTGTPMENRVEEFRALVAHVDPGLEISRGGPQAFRKSVAATYLRRNQEDVLHELPDRVEADEWVEFSGDDLDAYRQAVADRHFPRMRRAAFAHPATSAKLKRLTELVEDAEANGLKVIVFSYFRDVLDAVEQTLGTPHKLTGDLDPDRRQELVDAFSAADGHAVLLSQIVAGGVGLNLQAASVVIICEPQLKPSTETQAIARAHRMGQTRKVQVHRLLAVDSVDQRLLEILAAKTRSFDEYARRSDLAESSPAAVDISEQALAHQIIEEEQRRLLS